MTYLMNEETLGMGDAYDKSLQQARVDHHVPSEPDD